MVPAHCCTREQQVSRLIHSNDCDWLWESSGFSSDTLGYKIVEVKVQGHNCTAWAATNNKNSKVLGRAAHHQSPSILTREGRTECVSMSSFPLIFNCFKTVSLVSCRAAELQSRLKSVQVRTTEQMRCWHRASAPPSSAPGRD